MARSSVYPIACAPAVTGARPHNVMAGAVAGDEYAKALRFKRAVSAVSFLHGQGTATFRNGTWVQTSGLAAA